MNTCYTCTSKWSCYTTMHTLLQSIPEVIYWFCVRWLATRSHAHCFLPGKSKRCVKHVAVHYHAWMWGYYFAQSNSALAYFPMPDIQHHADVGIVDSDVLISDSVSYLTGNWSRPHSPITMEAKAVWRPFAAECFGCSWKFPKTPPTENFHE